ncbi:cytochrome P450 CYP749A22-like isoform X1 [Coffea arabica]|uniref:Cytochrome P450 CYP749A22-like isoform X1 n=1 Tax=Coffea arabica TaxID=13443 RepID=A0ABM4VPV9_COFAR
MESMKFYFVGFVLIYILFALIKVLHIIWWKPMRIQHRLESQGIKGPPRSILHGSPRELLKKKENTTNLSHDIFPVIQPHIYSWMNIYEGKIFLRWRRGAGAELVITDLDLIKEILNDKEQFFTIAKLSKYLKKIVGGGLGQSEGEKWVKLRKLANQAFHGESLRDMTPAMVESVEMMLRRWRDYDGKEIDVSEEFMLLTAEVISRTAFGSSYVEGEQIFNMMKRLGILTGKIAYKLKPPFIRKFFKDGDDIESDKLEKGIQDSIVEIVKKREKGKKGDDKQSFGEDFLGLLLKAHYDCSSENDNISIEEIIDECKTFYGAGHGTTSILLSWTILLLAINTDWQEKAREEVTKLFGQDPPNSEGISRLKTISMIINETLRLYPPAIYARRTTKEGAKLGNYKLPADLNISIAILAVHHDPQIWGDDAHLFNPERFSQGVSGATKINNPAAFLPFSLGPRTCVGSNFAITEVKIALSMILQRYAFTLSPSYVHSPVQMLALMPQHGVQVVLHAL